MLPDGEICYIKLPIGISPCHFDRNLPMAVPKILVVDDDSELSQMMAQFLARNGFMVYTAATGAEINQHISRGRIDLILLDVMLGEENGIELCRQLRAEQDVPIIFVSALAADHQRVTGYEVGADDYILAVQSGFAACQRSKLFYAGFAGLLADLSAQYIHLSVQWLAVQQQDR